jgi:uncharacterized protein
MRLFLWPRRSFSRSFQYFGKRVLRLTATPHAIAAGVAAGVFASWTPFLGFHFILAFVVAYLAAGNMIAAGLGTAFGNPLTFPIIWTTSYKFGNFLLDSEERVHRAHINLEHLFRRLEISQLWEPILKPMVIGAILPGIVSGLVFYALTYWSVSAFQARRRRKIADRALQRPQPEAQFSTRDEMRSHS